jgi:molecular chaperone DnaJ
VPRGIDNGQRLKLRGEGEPGLQGGQSGDLYVQIAVRNHPIFERQESEIICDVPISYTSAVLGAEIDVPTLDGKEKLKIPGGTPSGKIFKLKNKGVPIIGTSRRGDQHIRVSIEVPRKVSDEEKQILLKLQELESKDTERASRSWFEKVKSMFVP